MKYIEYSLIKGLMGEIIECYGGNEEKLQPRCLGLGKTPHKGHNFKPCRMKM